MDTVSDNRGGNSSLDVVELLFFVMLTLLITVDLRITALFGLVEQFPLVLTMLD